MTTLLMTFGLILLAMALLSAGLIFGGKPMRGGSCCDKADPEKGCAGCEKRGDAGRRSSGKQPDPAPAQR
jgi:hypothetical protein